MGSRTATASQPSTTVGGALPAARGAVLAGDNGRRCRGAATRAPGSVRPCRRLFEWQRHRAGAGAAPSRARSQPGAGQHLAGPDPDFRGVGAFWRWLAAGAPSDRAFLEAFFLWVYTPRAHADGTVGRFVEAGLAFPHPAVHRSLPAHDRRDPGARHLLTAYPTAHRTHARRRWRARRRHPPPRFGLVVAERVPDATFVALPGEVHLPFQESPPAFNTRVDAFWARSRPTSEED